MGNIIGIKLADGSFYPVMEEGQPFSKKLELTTVRDDQTTVHLDLYRSATGSMEDAEYVDTLVVENLVPHPKQEHSLNLNIKLDENNMLSAEIDDPETGAISNSKVSLITLKKEELAVEPDYNLASEDEATDIEDFSLPEESLFEEKTEDVLTEDAFGIIDENIIDDVDGFDKLPDEIDIEVPADFSDSEPTFLGENLNSEEDFLVEGETRDFDESFDAKDAMILGGTAAFAGAVLADNFSETEEIPTIEEDIIEESPLSLEDTQLEEIDIQIPDTTSETAFADDFDFPSADTEETSETAFADDFDFPSADTEETSETAFADDFALPSVDTEETSETAFAEDFAFPSADTEETSETAFSDDFAFPSADPEETSETAFSDDFALPSADTEETSEPAFADDFALPSVDPEETSETAFADDFAFPSVDPEETSETAFADDFALPSSDTEETSETAFADDFAFPSADTEETSESAFADDFAFSSADIEETTSSITDSELPNFDDFDVGSEDSFEMEDNTPFTFDSLPEFDEIPELKDNSAGFSDDFADMDFELPEINESKYDFTTSKQGGDPLFDSLYEENYKETEKSQKKTTIPVVICVICALICLGVLGIVLWLTKPNFVEKKDVEPTVTVPVESLEKELPVLEKEDLTSAKENEIVITPEPVVPEIPEPKVEVAPAKVIYRIKWGDTLWDLAESYYQNPWLYPKIAKANNIKNPDVIISGTDIEIPPLN